MAPIEPSFLNSNAGPLAQITGQLVVAGTLLALVCGNISNAHRNVPPAQHTRSQHTLHRRGIIIFATLAAIGLSLSAYFAIARRVLSYRQWAEGGGEVVPGSMWAGWYAKGTDGTIIPNEQAVWQLGRWMQDANIWQEGDLVAVSSSKAWWWTQQQFAASLAWSAYVGIEARRHNMPSFTIITFIVLSSLISINVAQNLFYIALLLTPDTSSSLVNPSYDPLWAPIGGVQAMTSILPSILLILTPHFPSALTLLSLQRWIVPLVRANIPAILPKHMGHRFTSTSAARRAYTPLFSVLAICALAMHIKQTILALADNTPKQRNSHFRFIWGSNEEETYTSFGRASMAAGRVLDVLHTHPAVSAAAWDVLLSAVSFCVYAAVRGIDPSAMLKYSLAPWLKLSSASNEDVPVTSTKPAAASSKQKRGRKASSSAASNAITSGAKAAADAVKSTTKRKSSGTGRRPTRTKEDDDRVANITTENILESTRRSTRVKNPQQLSRITSRDTDDEDEDEDQEEDIDDSFVPTPATKRDVSSVVHSMAEAMPGNMGEVETAGEAAALGWGMFVLGGLGVLSSAVLGADG